MEYDVVIATRNRPEALRLSVPLMLAQSRKPKKLVIVDSSDDHAAVQEAVETAARDAPHIVELISSRAGSSHQRNIGIDRCDADVVMFPDDDSLWRDNVAEAKMRAYETDNRVAAVCAAETPEPPPGVLDAPGAAYDMTAKDRLKQRLAHTRAKVERALAPDPFVLFGREHWKKHETPAWLRGQNTVLVEWMTGIRMSFRRDVIERVRFCESLGRYALFEDVEASYAAWDEGLVVGARDALVYHHKAPGSRAGAKRLGAAQLLNRAYIIARHAEEPMRWERRVSRYARYKALQYKVGGGGERLIGAQRAVREIPAIMRASRDELDAVYHDAYERCCA